MPSPRSLLVLVLLACAGCDGGEPPDPDAGPDDAGPPPSVLGVWQADTPIGILGVTLSGEETSGMVETLRSTPVDGDLATCRREELGRGTFAVVDGAMELDTPTAVERTTGCTSDQPETSIDPAAAQGFADELSGPFDVTADTLRLGAYPPMMRVD